MLFGEARKRFGVRETFTRDGVIFVKINDGFHKISSRDELDRLEELHINGSS